MDWADSRITLINFWATWCGPCAKEMPFLQGMVDEFGGDGFRVLGIATDKKTDKIMSHLRTLGISYPNLLDRRRVISRAWGGIGILPTSFLVDQDGTVLRRYVGGTEPQLEALKRDVADLLAGRPLGPPPPAYRPPAEPAKADDESDHDHDH